MKWDKCWHISCSLFHSTEIYSGDFFIFGIFFVINVMFELSWSHYVLLQDDLKQSRFLLQSQKSVSSWCQLHKRFFFLEFTISDSLESSWYLEDFFKRPIYQFKLQSLGLGSHFYEILIWYIKSDLARGSWRGNDVLKRKNLLQPFSIADWLLNSHPRCVSSGRIQLVKEIP